MATASVRQTHDKIEQKDPRFKNLEKKVGIFVSLVVIVILALFFFMAKERGIFTKKYSLFFIVDSGSGFIEGMPVKLSGFKIGKLKSMSLTSEARVKVVLEINKEYQKWIRQGSVARMMKEGVIGEAVVDVSVGPSSGQMIEDGKELPNEKVMGIEEMLVKEVKPVLQEIKETISYINNPEGDIKRSLANIKKLSEGLLNTKNNLDEVLKEAKVTVKEATSAFSKLDNIGEKAMPVIDKLNVVAGDAEKASKKIPEVVDKVDKVMDDVKEFSNVLSKKSHGVKNMLEDTEDMLNDTKDIIKGAKDTWPISSMVSPPKEEFKLIPLDGSGKGE
ncbi:MAG: MCE family protein [Deltaproteobacteria bacterium]|nr:MCE family protein [Deltaproteobacteria bacterium]